MKKALFCSLIIFLLAAQGLFAQRKIVVKMASPVPENTPWGKCLNDIAAEWRRITNGEVEVIVYHNGVAGNENEVVRNLKINQMQAGVLSTFGMYEVIPEIMTLSFPFLIRNDKELNLVLAGLKDELERRVNEKGYVTIAWTCVGWVKIFSKAPVFVPADLKKQKLGTNEEQREINQAFKTMGFQMVPVARNDILIALNSGMADAVYQSPIAVGSSQIFGLAKNMASINIAPFMGSIIINQQTWRRIPDKYKPQLLEAAKRIETALDKSMQGLEDEVIKTMKNYGLVVNQLTPAQEKLWYDEVERVIPGLVGTALDRDTYTRIEAILKRVRD